MKITSVAATTHDKKGTLASCDQSSCAAIQWDQIPGSLSEVSSFLYYASEQRRLWRDCVTAKALFAYDKYHFHMPFKCCNTLSSKC